jgi:protein phosphatase
LRAGFGVNQTELAERIGITRQTLTAIESGKREMTWVTFVAPTQAERVEQNMAGISAAAVSHVGKVRGNNEDNFFVNGQVLSAGVSAVTDESDGGIYAVCDGMGGEEHGEIAAAIAVDTLGKYYRQLKERGGLFENLIVLYTDEANARICAETEQKGGRRMGTTFAVLFAQNNTACICNIGDSRIYLFRDGSLVQLSQDHTQLQRLIEMGIITPEKAKTHPERHILTQHLGVFPDEMVIEPFTAAPREIKKGDVFLLCSDGLTDMLEDAGIGRLISRHPAPRDAAEALIEAALEKGGKDNVTVVVVKMTG